LWHCSKKVGKETPLLRSTVLVKMMANVENKPTVGHIATFIMAASSVLFDGGASKMKGSDLGHDMLVEFLLDRAVANDDEPGTGTIFGVEVVDFVNGPKLGSQKDVAGDFGDESPSDAEVVIPDGHGSEDEVNGADDAGQRDEDEESGAGEDGEGEES
jgi:hypothetical protein